MDRKSKDRDIAQRREAYGQGLARVAAAVAGFRELTGIDLTGDVDISGRRMGHEPFVKLTAERLAEVTAKINDDVAHIAGISDDIATIAESFAQNAVVVSINRGLVSVAAETEGDVS